MDYLQQLFGMKHVVSLHPDAPKNGGGDLKPKSSYSSPKFPLDYYTRMIYSGVLTAVFIFGFFGSVL